MEQVTRDAILDVLLGPTPMRHWRLDPDVVDVGVVHHYTAMEQFLNILMSMDHRARCGELERLAERAEAMLVQPAFDAEIDVLETGFVESLANRWINESLDTADLLEATRSSPRFHAMVERHLRPC